MLVYSSSTFAVSQLKSHYTGISYGDRLWFKDTDAATSNDEDKEDYLGNIQIDS